MSGAVGSGGVVEDRGCGRQAGSDGPHEKDGDVHPGNGGGDLSILPWIGMGESKGSGAAADGDVGDDGKKKKKEEEGRESSEM